MQLQSLSSRPEAGEFESAERTLAVEQPVSALAAESIRPETLVHHRGAIDADTTLEEAQMIFRRKQVEFLAVTRGGRVIGLCARGQLAFVMSARFGFALYSQQPIAQWLVERPLVIGCDTPIRALLDGALARPGDAFYEDVVLTDAERRLIGLIKVEALVQLQSRLVAEQLQVLRRQHEELRQQHLALFRANHAARQSAGLYVSLFETHALGVALLDTHGVIHEYNQRLSELLNWGDRPLQVASLAMWVAEKDRPAFLALLEAHQRGEIRSGTQEFTLVVPACGERLFRISTGWVRETGQVCACLEDVTDQRTLERSAQRQEKQSLLDTLVGGIAHELNNKLTPVIGYSELLCLDGGGRRDYVDVITKSVAEAARIVQQLLELSRPPSHTPDLLDLRAVIEETLLMLKFRLREAGCQLRTVLPPEPVWVEADGGHLRQVELNLIINALHALDGRPNPVLTLEARQTGSRSELIVLDNGCGIPRENLGRIFDPFFTTKGPERGTGLGLSICSSLVRQNGGEITVESTLNQGTRFTVGFPISGKTTILPPSTAGRPESGPSGAVARGERVLVVEDELVLRRLIQEVLCVQFGCLVDLATDGHQALSMVATTDYAMILSDVRMPGMDGIEFFTRLRDSRPELAPRVAFVTGHPGDKDIAGAIREWNVPVLAKPFTMSRLGEVCRRILRAGVGRLGA
jgi:signal transduction histidine kinase